MQAGGGSRGRSPHLAAVGKEGEEVFVVARRQERHASLHGMQACMVAHEEEHVRTCKRHSLINYGEIEDPAKMTYSILDLIKRGLRAKTPSAKLHTE